MDVFYSRLNYILYSMNNIVSYINILVCCMKIQHTIPNHTYIAFI
jgi:hypothetical protein